MKDLILIFTIIILCVGYKCNLIGKINSFIITFNNFKSFTKNLLYVIPIITMYLKRDTISSIIKTKSSYRKVSETTKKVVASNQLWHCKLCNSLLDASYEIDHINPLYKHGNNDISNLQALCRNCHGKKTINDKLNI